MNLNNVALCGRAGRDPEVRHFESGKILAELSMAVQRPFKNADGSHDTDWFQVKFWGKAAEAARDYLKKGQIFGVVGRLEVEKWQDQQGNNRSKVVIVANELKLGPKPQGEQRQADSPPPDDDFGDEDECPF